MTSDLDRLTRLARGDTDLKFHSLMGMLVRREGLHASFERLAGNKAPGVDGMRKDDYQEGLPGRIEDLSERLRRLGYKPQPVRRVFIPKADGGRRPLGIPAFEDRIVQDRLSQMLQAIWEPEFRSCSYGFRSRLNCHDALRRVAEIVTVEKTQFVVEADIKGFFNHVSHEWMMKFLGHRITDSNLLRIIHRFLKGGVMEDGVVHASDEGTPQGGLVSPVLANIYLHYVLDLWFEKLFARQCRGKAYLVRYADDFVACFQLKEDADRYMAALVERLASFNLEIEPTKTQLLRFGSFAESMCKKEGLAKPATFNFMGFTHFVTRGRKGGFLVGRLTERKRVRRKLKDLNERLRSLRKQGGKAMQEYAKRHADGHLQYYGISGNYRGVKTYLHCVGRLLFKWLNRRSQRKSLNWDRFNEILRQGRLLPKARIVHNLYNFFPNRSGREGPETGSRMV